MRTIGLAIAFATAFAWTAAAQVNVEVGKEGVKVDAPGARGGTTGVAAAHRASKISGMTVKNRANEDLGKVEDLVIDERGNIRYAAVSFGGFLGFNDKLFAVPWKALTIKNDVNSTTQYVELNVSKKYLENAPGFPSDKWPTFADPEVNAKVDAFYLREQDNKNDPKNDPNRTNTPRK
jgi:sporulation protein YlmC with PRC-barrel domain